VIKFKKDLIDSHFKARFRRFRTVDAKAKKFAQELLVSPVYIHDLGSDEEFLIREMLAEPYISLTDRLELDLAGRQINLDNEPAILANQVKFFDADRRHDKANAGITQVGCFTAEGKAFQCSMEISGSPHGLERNSNGRIAFLADCVGASLKDGRNFRSELAYHCVPQNPLSCLDSII